MNQVCWFNIASIFSELQLTSFDVIIQIMCVAARKENKVVDTQLSLGINNLASLGVRAHIFVYVNKGKMTLL